TQYSPSSTTRFLPLALSQRTKTLLGMLAALSLLFRATPTEPRPMSAATHNPIGQAQANCLEPVTRKGYSTTSTTVAAARPARSTGFLAAAATSPVPPPYVLALVYLFGQASATSPAAESATVWLGMTEPISICSPEAA